MFKWRCASSWKARGLKYVIQAERALWHPCWHAIAKLTLRTGLGFGAMVLYPGWLASAVPTSIGAFACEKHARERWAIGRGGAIDIIP
jgi:hypothetical protein